MRKITLRKAKALQESITEFIKGIEVNGTIELNEFQVPSIEVTKARILALDNNSRRDQLLTVVYHIRAAIGRANVESGVSDLLADAALLDKRMGHLKALVELASPYDQEVTNGRIAQLKEMTPDHRRYGFAGGVETGVFNQEQLTEFTSNLLTLKKVKQQINDKILELNVTTEITLTEHDAAVLVKEQLL